MFQSITIAVLYFPLLEAMTQVAKALAGLPNIIGFGTMNEPLPGYNVSTLFLPRINTLCHAINLPNLNTSSFIGQPDLSKLWGNIPSPALHQTSNLRLLLPLTPYHITPHHITPRHATPPSPPGPLRNGETPTAFQSMCLGSGHSISIPQYSTESLYCLVLGAPVSHSQLNTDKVSVWENGVGCIWKEAGVWDYNKQGEPILLNPHYFAKADFGREHYLPFSKKMAVALRQHLPDVSIFVEMPPHDLHLAQFPDIPPEEIPNAVNASHWVCSIMLYIFTM
jgi:hypothetical protein